MFVAAGGEDGFVSLEVAPEVAHDTAATITAARTLHEHIDQPNLLVKRPCHQVAPSSGWGTDVSTVTPGAVIR